MLNFFPSSSNNLATCVWSVDFFSLLGIVKIFLLFHISYYFGLYARYHMLKNSGEFMKFICPQKGVHTCTCQDVYVGKEQGEPVITVVNLGFIAALHSVQHWH